MTPAADAWRCRCWVSRHSYSSPATALPPLRSPSSRRRSSRASPPPAWLCSCTSTVSGPTGKDAGGETITGLTPASCFCVDPCRDQRREQRQASPGDPRRRGGGHDRRSRLGAETGPPRPCQEVPGPPQGEGTAEREAAGTVRGRRWSAASSVRTSGVSRLRRRSSTTTGSSRTRSTRSATRAGVCCRRPSARRPRRCRGCRWPTISGRLVAVRGKPRPTGSWRRDTLEERTFALPLPPDQRAREKKRPAA